MPVEHWNNRRRPTAVCVDFVRFIPLLDGRSLMAVESLPGRAYRLFPQSGRATEKLIGRRWPRPRQPSLEDGRASSQKTATKLRDLADSGADAGPFHLWPPREASKSLGAWSLECAVVRSRAPSNTRDQLQRPPSTTAPMSGRRRGHTSRPLSVASRCWTARSSSPHLKPTALCAKDMEFLKPGPRR